MNNIYNQCLILMLSFLLYSLLKMWLLLCIQQCRLMPFKICSYQITLLLIREHGSVLIRLFSVHVSRSCYNVAYLKLTITGSYRSIDSQINWKNLSQVLNFSHGQNTLLQKLQKAYIVRLWLSSSALKDRHTDRQTDTIAMCACAVYLLLPMRDGFTPPRRLPTSDRYIHGRRGMRARACVRRVWRHGQVMTEITREP